MVEFWLLEKSIRVFWVFRVGVMVEIVDMVGFNK